MASLAQERVLCKATDISAAAAQIPTWAKSMQYGQATCAQLARMSALPVLHFAGAQFAVKALSTSTCLKVRPLTCTYSLRAPCSSNKQSMLCEDLQGNDPLYRSPTQPHSPKNTQGFPRTLKAERHPCCFSASPGPPQTSVIGRPQTGRSTAKPACCSWRSCQARADVSLEEVLTPLSMHVQVQVPTELHLCEDLQPRLLQLAVLSSQG